MTNVCHLMDTISVKSLARPRPRKIIIYKKEKMTKRNFWDKGKDKIIKKYYPMGDWDNLFSNLPNGISRDKIYKRAKVLKIRSEIYWTKEEIKLFKKVYPHYTNKYISEKFFPKRNTFDIREKGAALKIRKSKEKSNKIFLPDDMILSLKNLSLKLGHTPIYHELVPNGLASQKTYERRFGGYRKACELAGLLPNYSFFGNSTGLFSKNGDLCYSYSEVFITNFFIENKIKYIKEEKYSNYFDDIELNTKRCDWYLADSNIFVEFFGFIRNKEYDIKLKNKLRILNKIKIPFIAIYPKELSEEFLRKTFL